ncbi:MAG: GDP-mannose 4,6-dehydratase [Nanoarchaeota archaeon]
MKKALITGITGQIGSYLAELLVEKGYEVYGIVRSKMDRRQEALGRINGCIVFEGDIDDPVSIGRIIKKVQPDEIYNLAAQSDAQVSLHLPEYTLKANGLIAIRIGESVRELKSPIKVFQTASGQMYGFEYDGFVNEKTEFHPRNPYAIAKLSAYWAMRYYREVHGMFCCNGIVFNSESPRRGENFVTRKITKGIADIMRGKQEKIHLGNLNARRDWSHAKDTARAMWMILQAPHADDYVVASGESHSVREFVELAFKHVGIEIAWKGEGVDEVGYDKKSGIVRVAIDSMHFRPHEMNEKVTVGDTTHLRSIGWRPEYSFDDLVKEMIDAEMIK